MTDTRATTDLKPFLAGAWLLARAGRIAHGSLSDASVVELPHVAAWRDAYRAIHQVPVGGEDLTAYVGSPRLICSTDTEPFDTTADGEPVIEHPEVGEVVWCDELVAHLRQLGGDVTTATPLLALDPTPSTPAQENP